MREEEREEEREQGREGERERGGRDRRESGREDMKMPYPTKGSIDLLTCTWPPEQKDIPTELYSAGVPMIAERIFTPRAHARRG